MIKSFLKILNKLREKVQYLYLKKIYGDHNSSLKVKIAINKILKLMPEDGVGLNIGSGKGNKIDPRIKNMEIKNGRGIDYVGSVESIPFNDKVFDTIILQEVLEHVEDPNKAMKEIYRVLKFGGHLYIQVPFIIGFHPCPKDYWRFTHQGIKEINEKHGFEVVDLGESVGSATGFYRICVEFFSIILSIFLPFMYRPLKALFALLFFPIKFLDPLISFSHQSKRISGGHFSISKKV